MENNIKKKIRLPKTPFQIRNKLNEKSRDDFQKIKKNVCYHFFFIFYFLFYLYNNTIIKHIYYKIKKNYYQFYMKLSLQNLLLIY